MRNRSTGLVLHTPVLGYGLPCYQLGTSALLLIVRQLNPVGINAYRLIMNEVRIFTIVEPALF